MTARLMSLDTAANRYEISRRTLERHIHEGRLKAVKIGSATRLVIEDADKVYAPSEAPKGG